MKDKLLILTDEYIKKLCDDPVNQKKYFIIKEILKSEKPFLNMDISYAYAILRDLGFSEKNLKDYYLKIIEKY